MLVINIEPCDNNIPFDGTGSVAISKALEIIILDFLSRISGACGALNAPHLELIVDDVVVI